MNHEKVGKGCGVIAAWLLLTLLAGFAWRFGQHAADRILSP